MELQAATMLTHTSPKQVITVLGKRLSITNVLARITRFNGTSDELAFLGVTQMTTESIHHILSTHSSRCSTKTSSNFTQR